MPAFPFHFIAPLGWISFIYLASRTRLITTLICALIINLTLCIFGLFWLEYFGTGFIFQGLAWTLWILPLCLLIAAGIGQIPLLGSISAVNWGLAWAFIEVLLQKLPISTPPNHGFFSYPLFLLQFIHIVPAQGYCILTSLTVAAAAATVYFKKDLFRKISGLVLLLFFATISIYGVVKICRPIYGPQTKLLKATVIQENLPFIPRSDDIMALLDKKAQIAAAQKPDLIIFPLYHFPESIQSELIDPQGFFSQLAQRTSSSLLVTSKVSHTVLKKNFSDVFSLMTALFSPNGKLENLYESVDRSPFHDKQQFLAPRYQILESPIIGNLGILICYESDKSKYAHMAKKLGAQVIVAVSNPGDSPYSMLPYYELKEDQLRAIETGLPVILATPSGFSGWIDSRGKIHNQTKLLQSEITRFEVPLEPVK